MSADPLPDLSALNKRISNYLKSQVANHPFYASPLGHHPFDPSILTSTPTSISPNSTPSSISAYLKTQTFTSSIAPVWSLKPQFSLQFHQREALDWASSRSFGIFSIEVGLGKTLVAMHLLKGRTLIVLPAGLIDQWISEFHKFLLGPHHLIARFGGPKGLKAIPNDALVVFSSFDILRREIAIPNSPLANAIPSFSTLIIDECHKAKNPSSITHQALRRVVNIIPHRWLLTGTILVNSSADFHAQALLADPFYSASNFSVWVHQHVFIRQLSHVPTLVLPPLHIVICPIHLHGIQQNLYNDLIDDFRTSVTVDEPPSSILAKITRACQQLDNSNCVLPKEDRTNPDFFIDHIHMVKYQYLLNLLNDIPLDDHLLLFSRFSDNLFFLHDFLTQHGIPSLLYHGGMSSSAKTQVLQLFSSSSNYRILLISTTAGNCGLNITKANHVILFEPSWNPAIEHQAYARSYRCGQLKPVSVYRFLIQNSLESWMDARLLAKDDSFTSFYSSLELKPIDNSLLIPLFRKYINSYDPDTHHIPPVPPPVQHPGSTDDGFDEV